MPTDRLPARFDPFSLSEQRARLEGTLALNAMSRLREVLGISQDGTAEVVLRFAALQAAMVLVEGEVSTTVRTRCQRCLADLAIPIAGAIQVALVRSDAEAAKVQDEFEPWVLGDDMVDTREFIEDELLLSLPAIPVHEDRSECDPTLLELWRAKRAEPARETNTPFAVLKDLKLAKSR